MAADFGQNLWSNWVEYFFILLIFIGFLVSIAIPNPLLNYLIIFCIGLMTGRVIYRKKGKQPIFPYGLIMFGFLLGYMINAALISETISAKWILVLFVIGYIISHIAHKKGYITI